MNPFLGNKQAERKQKSTYNITIYVAQDHGLTGSNALREACNTYASAKNDLYKQCLKTTLRLKIVR